MRLDIARGLKMDPDGCLFLAGLICNQVALMVRKVPFGCFGCELRSSFDSAQKPTRLITHVHEFTSPSFFFFDLK